MFLNNYKHTKLFETDYQGKDDFSTFTFVRYFYTSELKIGGNEMW